MLKSKQKQRLKSMAHAKKPVVIVGGNGLTETVMQEINQALNDHELIKIRINAADRAERSGMIGDIAEQSQSELVQQIGHIAVFYRQHPERPKFLNELNK